MKKIDKMWHFESHDEMRAYMAQGWPAEVYLTTLKRVAVRGEQVVTDVPEYVTIEKVQGWERKEGKVFPAEELWKVRRVLGTIDNYPAEDFAVRHQFERHVIHAGTMLDGLYQAGEHLAARAKVKGLDERDTFTAKEVCNFTGKGSLAVEWPESDVETMYTVETPTGRYQVSDFSLFDVIARAEKAEGVGAARQRRFTFATEVREGRATAARITFEADKAMSPLRRCWDDEQSRVVMCYPALDTKAHAIVCTNGKILIAHKLKGYTAEVTSELLWDTLNLPREVTQMKGTVTVDVELSDYREYDKSYASMTITAQDGTGKRGVVVQERRFPNWQSVIPRAVGRAITIDAKAMTKAVKQVMPQLNSASHRMCLTARRGAEAITLSGEDVDFSQSGTAQVPIEGGVACGVFTALNAQLTLAMLAFQPTQMHYTEQSRAVVFRNAETIGLMMPMCRADEPESTDYYPAPNEMNTIDIEAWLAESTEAKAQAAPKRGGRKHGAKGTVLEVKIVGAVSQPAATAEPTAAPKTEVVVKTTSQPTAVPAPTLADRLREALRARLAQAAQAA